MIRTIALTTLLIITPISLALNIIYTLPVLSAAARDVQSSYAKGVAAPDVLAAYHADRPDSVLPYVEPSNKEFPE